MAWWSGELRPLRIAALDNDPDSQPNSRGALGGEPSIGTTSSVAGGGEAAALLEAQEQEEEEEQQEEEEVEEEVKLVGVE